VEVEEAEPRGDCGHGGVSLGSWGRWVRLAPERRRRSGVWGVEGNASGARAASARWKEGGIANVLARLLPCLRVWTDGRHHHGACLAHQKGGTRCSPYIFGPEVFISRPKTFCRPISAWWSRKSPGAKARQAYRVLSCPREQL